MLSQGVRRDGDQYLPLYRASHQDVDHTVNAQDGGQHLRLDDRLQVGDFHIREDAQLHHGKLFGIDARDTRVADRCGEAHAG